MKKRRALEKLAKGLKEEDLQLSGDMQPLADDDDADSGAVKFPDITSPRSGSNEAQQPPAKPTPPAGPSPRQMRAAVGEARSTCRQMRARLHDTVNPRKDAALRSDLESSCERLSTHLLAAAFQPRVAHAGRQTNAENIKLHRAIAYAIAQPDMTAGAGRVSHRRDCHSAAAPPPLNYPLF